MKKYCDHLEKAEAAKETEAKADEINVQFKDIQKLKLEKEDLKWLKAARVDGMIKMYAVPGNNLVVPSLVERTHENPLEFLHLRNKKCPLGVCRENRSKLHTLLKKEGPLCLHTLLANCITASDLGWKDGSATDKPKPIPKIDRDLTSKVFFKIFVLVTLVLSFKLIFLYFISNRSVFILSYWVKYFFFFPSTKEF